MRLASFMFYVGNICFANKFVVQRLTVSAQEPNLKKLRAHAAISEPREN